MKFTLFFIPLAAAGLIPRSPEPLPGCSCDEIMCIQSMPNSCECFNEIQTACKAKCGPKLSFPLRDCHALETGDDNEAAVGFGILPVEVTNLPPVVARQPILPVISTSVPVVETKKPTETCECEQVFCIQSIPGSCACKMEASKACSKKCNIPLKKESEVCSPFEISIAPRSPILPVIPSSLPSVEPKKTAETCECEQVFCIESIPGSCACKMGAAEACALKCSKPAPKQADVCSPFEITLAARSPILPVIPTSLPAVEPKKTPETCECEQVFCAMEFPASCYCENTGIQACAKKCGGEPKGLKKCPALPNKTLIQRVAAPTAA